MIRVAEEKIIIELTSLKVPMYFKAHYIVPWSSLCLKVDILRIWSIEKREWPLLFNPLTAGAAYIRVFIFY